MILTTHYLEEAEALSDRVGIMKDGRLLALGTPEELKRQAGCDRFEDAFIAMVREAGRCSCAHFAAAPRWSWCGIR